ncbi:MAG TPA: hypothetical protein VE961_27340, partial [Pyrinomonadaceae bacterium]|nr:hypothetical protein [Pyrinomonadaceae bacterium]
MKKAYTVIALLVLISSLAMAAQAQSAGRRQWVATIPFQFSVGDATLPAGQYAIVEISPTADRTVVEIRMKNGGRTVMLQMGPVMRARAQQSVLIFRRYNDQYFFAQAWIEGELEGLNAAKSRRERAAEQDLAALNKAMETVAIRSR